MRDYWKSSRMFIGYLLRAMMNKLRNAPLKILGTFSAIALLIIPVSVFGWGRVATSTVDGTTANTVPTAALPVVAPTSQPTTTQIVSSSNQSSFDNHKTPTTNIHINGQAIPLPPSGIIHHVTTSGDGQSTLDVQVSSDSSSGSQSSTSTTVEFNTTTSSNDSTLESP